MAMADFLQDYQRYYRLRMQRYQHDPLYTRSYAAEKAIYEAISSCQTLEDFKEKLGNLNEQAAVALVIDQYHIRLAHYESMHETIKAAGCRRIIEKAAQCNNVQELMSMVNEEERQTMIAVTTDSIAPFNDFGYTERWQEWEKAEVPAKYQARYRQYAATEVSNLKEAWQLHTTAMQQQQPGWSFSFSRVHETRHRRLLPYNDAVVAQQITLTQQLLA